MKVFPFKIPKPANENLVIQVDREQVFYDKLHQHEEIQVSFMVEGYGKLLVKDNVLSYRPGDIYLIGGEMPHLFRSEPRADEISHMISFFLTKDAFGTEFFQKREVSALSPFFVNGEHGMVWRSGQHDLADSFLKLPEQDKFSQVITVLQIMRELSEGTGEVLSRFRYPKSITDADGERLQVVFDQVIRNFREPVSLKEIAAMVHMTPNAFCRYFKARTNKTFFEYLIAVRIEHACELLKTQKQLSVADVAYACGFRTLSHFNKQFRQLQGLTPMMYRKGSVLS